MYAATPLTSLLPNEPMQDTTPSCPFNILFHGTVGEKSKTSPGLKKYNIILYKNLKCILLIHMNDEKSHNHNHFVYLSPT
jgi:hypothetical protein